MTSNNRVAASIIASFFEVLQQLSLPPYHQSLVMKLSDLCHKLKSEGAGLELNNREDLDLIQTELVRLCQESAMDLEVRLQILEVVELRALNWRSNRAMEEFYVEKFRETRQAKSRQVSNTVVATSDRRDVSSTAVSDRDVSTAVTRRQLKIGASELVLESRDRRVLQLAHQHLETFFSSSNNITLVSDISDSDENQRSIRSIPAQVNRERLEVSYKTPELSLSQLKYSREALLTLANNPRAQDTPTNWSEMKLSLPDVIIRRTG